MSKYGLSGYFTAQPGQGQALAAILVEASQLMQAAPGCHLYMVATDQEIADRVWVIESWDSQEAHDASLKIDGVGELIGRARPLLAGPPVSSKLDIAGGI